MSRIKSTESKRLSVFLYTALFIVMLIFNFMTPMVADDFSYSFSFDEDIRMESVSQIIPSMQTHRQVLNGRVIAHSMVQFFLILPKAIFNIVNALNCLLIAFLFSRFFYGGKKRPALLLVCGAFLVWNYMPAFGQVFLWLDGSVNYSWGMSLFLLFILPFARVYLKDGKEHNFVFKLLFVALSFAVGAYSENGSLAAMFAAFCLSLLIIIRDRKLPLYLIFGFIAAMAGFVFLMSAPATAGRSAEMSLSYIMGNITQITQAAKKVLLPLYIIFALSFVAAISLKAGKEKLFLSGILFLSGLGSLAAFIFANYFTDRHFCFTIIFTVLSCLINLDLLSAAGKENYLRLLTAAAAVLFVFNLAAGSIDIASTFAKSLQREAAVEDALSRGEKDIALEIYQPATPYCAAFGLDDVQPYPEPETWPNCSIAMYYGFDSVIGYYPE